MLSYVRLVLQNRLNSFAANHKLSAVIHKLCATNPNFWPKHGQKTFERTFGNGQNIWNFQQSIYIV